MKVSKNMRWALPYIHATKRLVPHKRIKEVQGYCLRPGVTASVFGQCIPVGRKYKVTICLSDNEASLTPKPTYFHMAIETLAHELAHVVEWDHSPKHLALTARILHRFAEVAEEQGVRDTSRRLKESK